MCMLVYVVLVCSYMRVVWLPTPAESTPNRGLQQPTTCYYNDPLHMGDSYGLSINRYKNLPMHLYPSRLNSLFLFFSFVIHSPYYSYCVSLILIFPCNLNKNNFVPLPHPRVRYRTRRTHAHKKDDIVPLRSSWKLPSAVWILGSWYALYSIGLRDWEDSHTLLAAQVPSGVILIGNILQYASFFYIFIYKTVDERIKKIL